MYLKDPVRIEGLLCGHFFALIVQALIEREIRGAMKAANTTVALYPELRDYPSPSAERILEIFAGVSRHVLCDGDGRIIKTFEPKLDRPQLQVLELPAIPESAYVLARSTLKCGVRYPSPDVQKKRCDAH